MKDFVNEDLYPTVGVNTDLLIFENYSYGAEHVHSSLAQELLRSVIEIIQEVTPKSECSVFDIIYS